MQRGRESKVTERQSTGHRATDAITAVHAASRPPPLRALCVTIRANPALLYPIGLVVTTVERVRHSDSVGTTEDHVRTEQCLAIIELRPPVRLRHDQKASAVVIFLPWIFHRHFWPRQEMDAREKRRRLVNVGCELVI